MNIVEKAKTYLDKIKKEDKKINSFIHINENIIKEAEELEKKKNKGKLFGFIFGIKSNINVKGMPITCASKTLEDYIGAYDATVIEKIKQEDGLIIGMTNMDEFAAGVSGENSAFGPTKNPVNIELIPGGSSSGSAAAVCAGFCDVALGSDTGGSVRNPASNCGIVGLKPSYGLISRYGLIDLSMSIDQIGVLAKNVSDIALVLDVIKGKDEKDCTSFDSEKIRLSEIKKAKIGILKVNGVSPEIQELINIKTALFLEKYGLEAKEISIKHIELAVETYVPLVFSEFFSSTRKFDGKKYGKKIEEHSKEEVLRRILGGSEITKAEFQGAYYEKALNVKSLIKEEFESIFEKNDAIILPTVPHLPWKIGEKEKMSLEKIYAMDLLTIPANLAETCAISTPAGKIQGIPVGIQLICAKGKESMLLSLAKMIESIK